LAIGGNGPTEPERRGYALSLRAVPDAQLQAGVVLWVMRHVPDADSARVHRALAGSGFSARLRFTDAEAAGALRELYALGIPPAAVALVPSAAPPGRDTDLERRLEVFRARGGRFVPTWNWHAFLFGPFWYLKRGLWGKGVILLTLGLVPIVSLTVTLAMSLATLVYCGLAGDWDEYLWRVKRTQWW